MNHVFDVAIFGNSWRQQSWSVGQGLGFLIFRNFFACIFEWHRTWWAQNVTFVFILLRIWASDVSCLLSLLLAGQFSFFDITFEIADFLVRVLFVSQIMYNRRSPLLLRILMIEHALPLWRFINFWKHHFKRLLLMNHIILGGKTLFSNLLLICLQRLRKYLSTSWIGAQLIFTSFILSKIKTFLLEMWVFETCLIDLKLL